MPAFPSFVRPILNKAGQAYVSSGWGADRAYRSGTHNGLDFPAPIGTPVYAVADGKVTFAGAFADGSGNAMVVEHAPGLVTRYLHLDRFVVPKGTLVRAGQQIANSGASGIASSAAHLHFDIRGASDWLSEYLRRFGMPAGTQWPGEQASGGYGIPSEPLIPVDVYADKVKTAATSHGIPVHGAIGLGIVGVLGAGALGFFAVRYFTRRRS